MQEYAGFIFKSINTRSAVKKAIKKGLILIDGEAGRTGSWIEKGQKIELLKPRKSKKRIFKLNLEVVYEDEYLAVINKPPGYPTSGNFFKTIQNALAYNLKTTTALDALEPPLPAHRLDNPTSGILVCAKTRKTLIALQNDFAERKIQKTYYAIIKGQIPQRLEITSDIQGKPAHTLAIPKEIFKIANNNYTLAEVKPLTGRTHQIRIHLAEYGTPIVGDKQYGPEENGYFKNKNLFLFAGNISFVHPVTKENLSFGLKLPGKFKKLNYYRAR